MKDGESARQAGWALKRSCYDAWHRDPPAAQQAARRLEELARVHPADEELRALAAWGAAIAALTDGQLVPALSSLQAAQRIFEASGASAWAAETRVPQIMVLAMLGREAEAQSCAEAALALFKSVGDDQSVGKVEVNLGSMLFRQDRHTEAEPHFRSAAVRFARAGATEQSIMADVALANCLGWQLRFDEALQMYERARLRAQSRGLNVLLAQVQQGVGQIELHRGHWQRALHELAAAAQGTAEAGAPPLRRVEAEAALADAYLSVHLLIEAVSLYDAILTETRQHQLHNEEAWATLQRARSHARLGEASLAQSGFAHASLLYAEAGNSAVQGLVALEQGRLALSQGQPAQAAQYAERALAFLPNSGLAGWQLQARVLAADADAALGQTVCAEEQYLAVLAEATDSSPLPQLAWMCHAGLGALALAQGRWPQARNHLETAMGLVELVRDAIPGDEVRSALAAESSTVHDHLVAVATAQEQPAQLLLDMERGRGRSLALTLTLTRAQKQSTVPLPPDAAHLRWLRQQWRQSLAEGDVERAPALAGRVNVLEQQLMESHRRASLASPAPTLAPAAEQSFANLDLLTMQQALGPDCVLLSYHLQADTLLVCVATNEDVQQRSWAVPGLREQIASMRFQLQAPRHGGALAQRHGTVLLERVRRRLQQLHAALWAPMQSLLGGRRRCVLLPHRELHYVPFAALHDGQRWLAQDYELNWAPSAAVWLALQQRSQPRFSSALVMGVAAMGLPMVHEEARQVAAAFGADGQLLLDSQATQKALSAVGAKVDVLHLACHAQFRADSPAFSSLHLGDGPMSLLDLAQMRLAPDLVMLSACETGASRVAPGEELQGLVRSCLLAGTCAVLATFWQVEDSHTAALAVEFYAGLRGGLAPAAALRRAQANAATAGCHPFFWAGLALHGRG